MLLLFLINLAAITALILALFLSLQILTGVFGVSPNRPTRTVSESDVKILIPAHNEALVIERTLTCLQKQDFPPENVLVVADNCSDTTAEIASSFGVTVVERQDTSKKGKGYALAYGVDFLRNSSPQYVLVLDADCLLEPKSIESMCLVSSDKKVVQSKYLIKAPKESSIELRFSEFFFLIKNHVRHLGLSNLGLPVTLTGSGMLFPWHIISNMNIASSEIVEDTKLGLDILLQGDDVVYQPDATFFSYFPAKDDARETQSQRWEQGNMQLAIRYVPKFLKRALTMDRLKMLFTALNLGIPPITILVLFLSITLFIGFFIGVFFVSWLTFFISAMGIFSLLSSLSICWAKLGRRLIPLHDLATIPLFIIKKFPRYVRLIRNRQIEWVKTDRD